MKLRSAAPKGLRGPRAAPRIRSPRAAPRPPRRPCINRVSNGSGGGCDARGGWGAECASGGTSAPTTWKRPRTVELRARRPHHRRLEDVGGSDEAPPGVAASPHHHGGRQARNTAGGLLCCEKGLFGPPSHETPCGEPSPMRRGWPPAAPLVARRPPSASGREHGGPPTHLDSLTTAPDRRNARAAKARSRRGVVPQPYSSTRPLTTGASSVRSRAMRPHSPTLQAPKAQLRATSRERRQEGRRCSHHMRAAATMRPTPHAAATWPAVRHLARVE